MTNSAGYSGTPLVKKLGIKPEHRAVAINAPSDYAELIEHADVEQAALGALTGEYNFIHLFCAVESVLTQGLPACEKYLAQGGMIWASWPKKSSKLWIDLTEGGIRTAAFPLGLVDVKSAPLIKIGLA